MGIEDHQVMIYDMMDLDECEDVLTHSGAVLSLNWCYDSMHLLSGGVDCTVNCWNTDHAVKTGCLPEGTCDDWVTIIKFNDALKRFVVVCQDAEEFFLCDPQIHKEPGEQILMANYEYPEDWRDENGELPTINAPKARRASLVSAHFFHEQAKEATKLAPPAVVKHKMERDCVSACTFSPDGQKLFGLDDNGEIFVIDMQTMQIDQENAPRYWEHQDKLGFKAFAGACAWTGDNKVVAGGRWHQREGWLVAWQMGDDSKRKPIHEQFLTHIVRDVRVLKKGSSSIAVGGDEGQVSVYDWSESQQDYLRTSVYEFCQPDAGIVSCFCFSRDKLWVAVGGGHESKFYDAAQEGKKGIAIWRPSTEGGLQSITTALTIPSNSMVHCLEFSPNCKFLAVGYEDSSVHLFSAPSFTDTKRLIHCGAVHTMSWCPDSVHLVSGGVDCTVTIWNTTYGVKTGTLLLGGDGDWLRYVKVANFDRIVAVYFFFLRAYFNQFHFFSSLE